MNLELLAQWSQIIGAVIFLVLVVLIWNRWIAPAVLSYQESKNAELAEMEARRERMRADIVSARAGVEAADADARTIRERVAQDAERDRARILAEAKAEAERTIANAEGELARARFAASDRLRIEFIEKALLQARAIAGGQLDTAANTKLVDATVESLAQGNG